MAYNDQTGNLIVAIESSGAPATYTFKHSTASDYLIQPTYESLSVINPRTNLSPTGQMPRIIGDDSFILFQLEEKSEIFMMVNTRTSECAGLWTKPNGSDDFTWKWLRVNGAMDGSLSHMELRAYHNPANLPELAKFNGEIHSEVLTEENGWDNDIKKFIALINGYFYQEGTGMVIYENNNIGYGTVVNNLFPAETIENDVSLCISPLEVNFTDSEFFEKIPQETKDKLEPVAGKDNVYKWPWETSWSDATFYLLYEHRGTWTRATFANTGGTWAIERRFDQRPVTNEEGDAKILTSNLKNMPKGKYKITGLTYLRLTNEDEARFDVPGSGFISDFLANYRGDPDSIENYQFESFEIDLSGDINSGSGGISPNCQARTVQLRSVTNAGGSYSDSQRNTSVCSVDSGGGLLPSMWDMMLEGMCNIADIFKGWADNIFLTTLGWMKASIGLVSNPTDENSIDTDDPRYNPELESPTVPTGGETPISGGRERPTNNPANNGVMYASSSLTAGRIDEYIRSKQPNSPLIGKGSTFISAGQQHQVNPAFMVGIANAESSLGIQASQSGFATSGTKNAFGMRGGDSVNSHGFRVYSSYEAGIEDATRNAGSATYRNLDGTPREFRLRWCGYEPDLDESSGVQMSHGNPVTYDCKNGDSNWAEEVMAVVNELQ